MARKTVESPSKSAKKKRITKELPVRLTQAEWEEAVKKHITKGKEVDSLVSKKKLATKDFTDRILVATREKQNLEKMVDTHTEDRAVDCEEIVDFGTNRISIVRLDTREEIDERAMEADEREKQLAATQSSLLPEEAGA